MAAEELIERVLAGDVEGDPLAAPAGPAPHLPQAGDRAREGDADRGVELADVDSELERVGGDDREQLAPREVGLDRPPLLRRVAGAVRRDPRGEPGLAELLQPHPGEALDQLDPAAALEEADRARAVDDQVRKQLGGLGEHRAAVHRLRVDHRRVPDRDPALRARRAVGVDERELRSHEPAGELERVGDRGRGADEPRLGAVDASDPAQAAQDVGDVRAEDAAIRVRLVDHHPAQVGEEVPPALVVGEQGHVEHVRVGEHQVRAAADRRPVVARRVAVVDRVAELGQRELGHLARLILRQRLGRVDVERPGLRVGGDRVEHRKVERQRLPRGGAAGDDHVALPGGLQRLDLVRVELGDPGPPAAPPRASRRGRRGPRPCAARAPARRWS